LERNLENLEKF
jgi:hypothetical protein